MDFKNKLISIFALWVVSTSAAFAISEGFYVGAQAGYTNTHNKSQYIPNGVPGAISVSPKTTNGGARLFLGYALNPYAAFEMGYTYFGPAKYTSSQLNLNSTPAVRESAVDFDGKLMYAFYGVGVYGKAGLAYMRVSQSGNLSPAVNNGGGGTNQGVRPLVGVGVSYQLQNWIADLSWTRIISSGSTIQSADFIAVGLAYSIVDKHCGQFLC